ncbi:PAS domain-containing sensor histidine kinase [Mesorhizobium caraganae]|uniref:PAS domain-containing sensor histidine kinase n=1 Tax=Mesorhizobium caraganae TaxID=483206 RepID=UPI0035E3BDEC
MTPVENLEDLYENAPCGYLSLAPDGRIVKANATFSAWIGFSQHELCEKRLHDLLNVAGRIFFETHFAPLLRMQGFFNEVALDFVTNDGSKIPVLANAMERRDDEGGLLFTRITISKAADRRRYERELVDARAAAEAAKRELQALNASLETRIQHAVEERFRMEESLMREREMSELREQFIAILGHDLRNPLASFGGALRMLRRERLTPQGERLLDLLQGSILRMAGLIDNVLDFARGRLGGGIGLNIKSEPLQPVLEQVVGELRAASPDANIEADFAISKPVPCDHVRVGQLASNLLGNALTHGDRNQAIRLQAITEQDEFVLWVGNKGKPIPQIAMKRLFQPFVRGGASGQGLGLGLHIASEIAKAHGGTLTAESSNVETRFTFRMPLARARDEVRTVSQRSR